MLKVIFTMLTLIVIGLGCAEAGQSQPTKDSPTATATAIQTPTPEPVDLSESKNASMWISLSKGDYSLKVSADPSFDVDEYDLTLLVDGSEYCNTTRMYADEGWYELGCESEERLHDFVERVSAQTPKGDLRCERNIQSTKTRSIFACDWR